MKYFYCKGWFRANKTAAEVWSMDKARLAHERGEPYVALANSSTAPTAFIEVSNRAISVGFLDDKLRESLTYSFQVIDESTVFLAMATRRTFVGDSDTVMAGRSYYFYQDGALVIEDQDLLAGTTKTSETKVDVGSNYEARPSFDHYDSLIRMER